MLLKCAKIAALVLLSVPVWGSQGISINDQILTDYRNAKSFRGFVEKLTKNGFPGDYQYVQQIWKAYPELLKDSGLPKLIFESKQFVLREGPSEIKVQKVEGEYATFLINGNKVTFGLYDKSSLGMKKIMTASRARKTAHFALMPVVWAADAEGVPSKLQVAVKALVSVLRDEEGLPQDLIMWQWAESIEFRTQNRTSLEKNVGEKCLREIESAERAFASEQTPFFAMKCTQGYLDVSLQGIDQDKKMLALNLGPDRLKVRRGADVNAVKGLETFVFNHNSKDELDETDKAANEDEPVSASSSPFQRDMDFSAATKKDQVGVEYLDRFINIAGNRDIRNLCGICEKQVNEYARIAQAYDLKTLQLRKAQSDARAKAKSTK